MRLLTAVRRARAYGMHTCCNEQVRILAGLTETVSPGSFMQQVVFFSCMTVIGLSSEDCWTPAERL